MLNILLIEDDVADQKILQRYLDRTEQECKLLIVPSLAEARVKLQEFKIDLVLCDFNLPDGTALNFLSEFGDSNLLPIVVITSQADIEKATDSLKNGAFDFITKGNINVPELQRVLLTLQRHISETRLRISLEEKLEQNFVDTRAILDNSRDGIWSLDQKGGLLIINKRARESMEKFLGYSPTIGDRLLKKLPDSFEKAWRGMFNDSLLGEHLLGTHKFHDGKEEFFLETSTSPIESSGKIQGVIFVSRNVTKRELTEELVRNSEKNFRSIFEGAELPILLENLAENTIIELNQACAELHSYSQNEMVGMSIFDTIPPEHLDQAHKNYTLFLAGELPYLESFIYTSDKRSIPVRIDLTEINYNGQKCNLLFLHDISQQKELEEKLLEERIFAEKTAAFKSKFLANMSHEIRTPMNAMIGFTDLLAQTSLNEEQSEYLSLVQQSGDDLLVIINDILDISKLQAGKMELRNETLDLGLLLKNVIQLNKYRADNKGIGFDLVLSDQLPTFIDADSTRLTQILNNLVSNAIKFTQQGSVTLSVTSEKVDDEVHNFVFSIKDTGVGLSLEDQKNVFEDFSQVDSSLQRTQKGTGLGLSIVKQIVHLMEGKLSLQSTPKIGSTFTVTLPFQLSESTPDDQSVSQEIPHEQIKKLRLLLVEDNEVNLILAKRVLEKLEIKAEFATNGEEAVKIVNERMPDLIFMDIQMPVMDGFEATRAIRKFSDVPILAMTAHVLEQERQNCMEAGMQGFIPKPFKKEDIIVALNSFVAQAGKDHKDVATNPRATATDPIAALGFPNLIQLADGDQAFIIKLLDTAIRDWSLELKELKMARNNNDLESIKHYVHKLRSSFTLLELEKLKDLSVQLEENPAQPNLLDDFLTLLLAALSELQQKRKSLD